MAVGFSIANVAADLRYDRGKGRLAAARKKKNNVYLVLWRNYSNSNDFVKGGFGEEIVNYFTPNMKKFGVKPNI